MSISLKVLLIPVFIFIFSLAIIGNSFHAEAKCVTDANGHAIGPCESPSTEIFGINNSTQSSVNVPVPTALYVVVIIAIAGGGISVIILKKMK